jgi:hemerythrin
MKKNISSENKDHKFSLEHNVFIIWKPEYNLGIPIIDEQHRGIVTTINSLYFGIQNHNVEDMLSSIIDMMYDYTRIHFSIEEKFLEMINLPNVAKHHELHSELLRRLNKAGKDSLTHGDPHAFMDFLKQWWVNHICNEDFIWCSQRS